MTKSIIRNTLKWLTTGAALGALAVAITTYTTNPVGAAELKELIIALLPNDNPEGEIKAHKPMTDHLEKALGIPIKVQIGIDYTAVIEALRNNHVQVAYLGPFSYVLAHEAMKGAIEPLVTGVRKSSGVSTYNSAFLVRRDAGIDKVSDIGKEHAFGFADPASTSGYLVPLWHLQSLGIDPNRDFKSVFFAGGHAAVQMALQNGKIQAAGDNLPSFHKLVKQGRVKEKDIKIIWTSPPIPGSPITIRSEVSWEIKYKLMRAFMGIPEGVDTYEGKILRYEPAYDADYDIIRKIKKAVGDKLKN